MLGYILDLDDIPEEACWGVVADRTLSICWTKLFKIAIQIVWTNFLEAWVEATVVNAVFVRRAVTWDSTLWLAWQPLAKKAILDVGTQALAETVPKFGIPLRNGSFPARIRFTWVSVLLLYSTCSVGVSN